MRILHFADVHLDRPLVGLPQRVAERQRRVLMDSFTRLLEIAKEKDVELVTIGGDLWEEEHVRADTRQSVAHALGQLGRDVLIVCGNHDPLLPGGSYRRTQWPENVKLVPIRSLERSDYGNVSIWSVSWGADEPPVRAFPTLEIADDGGTNLALIHGTAPTTPFADDSGSYFPFNPAELQSAGIRCVLAGHIHQASFVDGVVYPGSPEPLGWGETGRHCCALVDVNDGEVDVDLIDVNTTEFRSFQVDCTGCGSSAEAQERVEQQVVADSRVLARVSLVGEIGADCEIDPRYLAEKIRGFAFVQVIDRTEPLLDIEKRKERNSLDGLFVRKLAERIESSTDEASRRQAELALEAGLRALEGRERLLYVG